jgi:Xaa-Pro aminopeptidase
MTRNFVLGRPQKEFQKKYDILKEVQAQTLKLFQAGVDGTTIDGFSRRALGGDAVFFSHSLGHGVGLEIHELPRIAALSKNTKVTPATILQENEVVTCEPGIYFPGQFGIRIEDLLVVRKNTSQVLSRTTKNLILL